MLWMTESGSRWWPKTTTTWPSWCTKTSPTLSARSEVASAPTPSTPSETASWRRQSSWREAMSSPPHFYVSTWEGWELVEQPFPSWRGVCAVCVSATTMWTWGKEYRPGGTLPVSGCLQFHGSIGSSVVIEVVVMNFCFCSVLSCSIVFHSINNNNNNDDNSLQHIHSSGQGAIRCK